jgi:hypothetical protein
MGAMELRPELSPPPVGRSRLEELSREIERISGLLYAGEPAGEAIAAFNAETGHAYDASDFAEYHGWRSLDDFAVEAARPAYPKVPDVTRDELVEIVRRLLAADPETDFYLLLLRANVAHPGASDLIYQAGPGDAEQIVDALLSHRPIAL